MDSELKIKFSDWYRDNYNFVLWCDDNDKEETKENYNIYLKNYKEPEQKIMIKLYRDLIGYYHDEIGDPSYSDGI